MVGGVLEVLIYYKSNTYESRGQVRGEGQAHQDDAMRSIELGSIDSGQIFVDELGGVRITSVLGFVVDIVPPLEAVADIAGV